MRRTRNMLVMVLGGMVGAWSGYWIGHGLGLSRDADWPARIGGGAGAIALAVIVAILGVVLAAAALAVPAHHRARRLLREGARAQASILDIRSDGLTIRGLNMTREKIRYDLEVHPPEGPPYRAWAVQFMTQSELTMLTLGAEVDIRYDREKPFRVAIEGLSRGSGAQ